MKNYILLSGLCASTLLYTASEAAEDDTLRAARAAARQAEHQENLKGENSLDSAFREENVVSARVECGKKLLDASSFAQVSEVRSLLEKNADVNYQRASDGFTPLVSLFSMQSTAKLFMENGFLGTHYDDLPLIQTVQLLLEHKADPNLSTDATLGNPERKDGYYYGFPLNVAARSNFVRCVELLLAHKADITAKDKNGFTAIMDVNRMPRVAGENYDEVTRLLVAAEREQQL